MNQTDPALIKALRRLLRPVVGLLIQKKIPLRTCVELLKEVYVNIAGENLQNDLDKATDSHISLITGVHRKDVKKYRHQNTDPGNASAKVSDAGEMLATWAGTEKYLDSEGKPRQLPYINKEKRGVSFVSLAEQISTDIPARALLDEFIRMGNVSYDKLNNTVTLKAESIVPQEGWEDKLYYFGSNCGDHLTAAVTNILSPKPVFLDRSVYHDGLTAESVRELKKISEDQAMKMLRAVNRHAFERSEKDKSRPNAKHRVNLGAYFFSDDGMENEPGENT